MGSLIFLPKPVNTLLSSDGSSEHGTVQGHKASQLDGDGIWLMEERLATGILKKQQLR